jgi:2-polyprenyl-6-methoxyphenol hydroxylase-like FAD-dependent oxidoreductase
MLTVLVTTVLQEGLPLVIGQARAREGCRDALIAAAAEIAASTQADPGCELYAFAVDVNDPQSIMSVEVWSDRAALDAHIEHDHTRQFLGAAGDLVAGEPVMRFYSGSPATTSAVPALMGVDVNDLGAPCQSEFRNAAGKTRAVVHLPQDVIDSYGGGFIGLLRPELYERLLAALPPGSLRVNQEVISFEQDERAVTLSFADGHTEEYDVLVGADGIDSLVRRTFWGEQPKREHNLHIFGGFTFDDSLDVEPGRCIVSHNRRTQGSWTAIRHKGRYGYQWWVLTAHDARTEFTGDFHQAATELADGFAHPLPDLVAATEPGDVQRWVIRDRKPLPKWSAGRVTLIGDAAHPTSPYAAYGAGMATEDGYYLGRRLAGLDLTDHAVVTRALLDFVEPRRPHTAFQSETAYKLGQMFHHAPSLLAPVRDAVFDHTRFLQKVIGESTPGEIVKQLGEIDRAEADFAVALGRS